MRTPHLGLPGCNMRGMLQQLLPIVQRPLRDVRCNMPTSQYHSLSLTCKHLRSINQRNECIAKSRGTGLAAFFCYPIPATRFCSLSRDARSLSLGKALNFTSRARENDLQSNMFCITVLCVALRCRMYALSSALQLLNKKLR